MSRVRKRQPPLAIPDSPEEIHPKEEVDIQLSKLRNNFDMVWSKYTYLISDNGFFTTEYFTDVLSRKLPITFENAEYKQAVFTDGGGELASRDITGQGKVVMDHNPYGHGIWTIPHIRNLDNDLLLQEDGLQDIDCFGASPNNTTPAFTVSGFFNLDILRTLSISVGATVADQVDFTGLSTYFFGGAITATGGIVPGGNITMADDEWIGLGGAAGRLVFDATPAPDALNFQNCDVNMFNNSVLGETPLLSIYGWAAFGALRSLQISCGLAGDDISYFNGTSFYGFNGDLIIYGNNIQDAGGAWIDSDGAGNTTLQGNCIVIDDLTVDTDTLFVDASEDSIGVNTLTPKVVASATLGALHNLINLYNGAGFSRITAQGTLGGLLDLVDLGGGADDKWLNLFVDAGIGKFGSVLDDGSAYVRDNILIMDLGSGNVSLGYDLTVTGNNILDAGGAWIDSDGAGNTTFGGNLIVPSLHYLQMTGDAGDADVLIQSRFGTANNGILTFQADGSDTITTFYLIPEGVGAGNVRTNIFMFNSDFVADQANWEAVQFSATSTEYLLNVRESGSGSLRPFNFQMDSNTVHSITTGGIFQVDCDSIYDSAGAAWIDSDGGGNTTAQGNLTTTGHLGVDIAAATDRTLYVSDTALSITATYYGIHNEHTKTAGVTDENDHLYGNYNTARMNDDGSTIGHLWALAGIATLSAGTVGGGFPGVVGDLVGVYGSAVLNGGVAAHDMIGIQSFVDANAATISNDVAGVYTVVDIEVDLVSIGGNAYGYYLSMDVDQDPVGLAYGLYMNLLTNVDYGIYQGGAAVTNYFEGNIHGSGSLILDDNLEAGDGFITAIAARAAEDSIIGQFHVFVTPSDVDHDYFALGDKVDGQVIMITNDGAVIANVDQDVAITGFTLCINETALARWHSADSAWYIVRG